MLVTTLVEKTVDGKIVKLEKFETETFCQEVGTSKFIHFFRIFTLKSHYLIYQKSILYSPYYIVLIKILYCIYQERLLWYFRYQIYNIVPLI